MKKSNLIVAVFLANGITVTSIVSASPNDADTLAEQIVDVQKSNHSFSFNTLKSMRNVSVTIKG
ncbi:MAG: hypothetical protein QM479_01065, partial [Pseudomonadota bacterium]